MVRWRMLTRHTMGRSATNHTPRPRLLVPHFGGSAISGEMRTVLLQRPLSFLGSQWGVHHHTYSQLSPTVRPVLVVGAPSASGRRPCPFLCICILTIRRKCCSTPPLPGGSSVGHPVEADPPDWCRFCEASTGQVGGLREILVSTICAVGPCCALRPAYSQRQLRGSQ